MWHVQYSAVHAHTCNIECLATYTVCNVNAWLAFMFQLSNSINGSRNSS